LPTDQFKAVREAMEVCMTPTVKEGKAMLARIAELEAVLRALVVQVEYQDDVLDPTSGLVQAMRDAKSHLKPESN